MNINNMIRNIGSIIPRNLHYCDVGARWGINEPWESFRDVVNITSFEPDEEEFASLVENKHSKDMIYPYALSSGVKTVSYYLTKARGASSIYKPNQELFDNYPDCERVKIEKTVTVETTSLDTLQRDKVLTDIDFIKMDVQGSELNVLKGGVKLLSENILGVEVEVLFQPLYEGQPFFSDIDAFIRSRFGLQMQDLRKTYWKYPEGIGNGGTKGKVIFGDALYFRSPHEILSWCERFNKNEAADKLQMACLMGIVYGYMDYSLCLLSQPSINKILERDTVNQWRDLIFNYGKTLHYKGRGAGRLSRLFNLLYRMCQPIHEGWASQGQHLGTRKCRGIFS